MKTLLFLLSLFLLSINSNAQSSFNPKIDKDSLFQEIMKRYPDDDQKLSLQKGFKSANEDAKDYIIAVLYNSAYTKDSLIANYDKHEIEFSKVKSEYSKLVPKNHIVQVSFYNSEIFLPKQSISIVIYKIKNGYLSDAILEDGSNLELISRNNGLVYGSSELNTILKTLNWDEKILKKIESYLHQTGSYSIRNGEPALFEYKRYGLGVYSYKIFEKQLTAQQILENNDGCNSIYYKKNVVLLSDAGGGGPKGVLCFQE